MTVHRPTAPGVDPEAPDAEWRPDAYVAGFESRELPLSATPEQGEPDEPIVATVVRRTDTSLRATDRAVLYVHGWNDYFFQTHLAEAWESLGYAFYAVELRRYGRSFRPGQFYGYVNDLSEYAEELDAAAGLIRQDHERLAVMGHSTGGLTASLWVSARPGLARGLVLNSPWLALQVAPGAAPVIRSLLAPWERLNPTNAIPVTGGVPVAVKATHTSYEGSWNYDLELKSAVDRPLRVGWLQSVLRGHRQVAAGLSIDCPVLLATAERSQLLRRFTEEATRIDTVLDVENIRALGPRLGRHITLVQITDGLHDLTLSAPKARDAFFEELRTWVAAYLR